VCVLEIKQGGGLRTNPGKKSTKNSKHGTLPILAPLKKKNPNHMQQTLLVIWALCIDSIIGCIHQGLY
jgi:hypothetical protein